MQGRGSGGPAFPLIFRPNLFLDEKVFFFFSSLVFNLLDE